MLKYINENEPERSVAHLSSMDVEDKIKLSISLMKSVHSIRPYQMAYSGGKDSVVMDMLATEAGLAVPKVYNNTTIDPEGTISFCEKHGCRISRNNLSFLDLVERKGMPTMFRRFCCKELKEKYISDYLFVGIRRDESVKRTKRYTCFEDSYEYTKKVITSRFFPLLFFTDADISYCVQKYSLEMHPLYYDHKGRFCVDRRLGCIGCPLQGDRGRMDYLRYPKLLKQVIERTVKFHESHGRTRHDAYLNVVYNLFYSNNAYEKYEQAYKGLFDINPKETLEEYFLFNLP